MRRIIFALFATLSVACSNVLGYDEVQFGSAPVVEPPVVAPLGPTPGPDAGNVDAGPPPTVAPPNGPALGLPTLPPAPDGGAADAASPGGPVDKCAGVSCVSGASCNSLTGTCACAPGFVATGAGACVAPPPGDPTTHSEAAVCSAWNDAHALSDTNGWTAGPTECDPGTISQANVDDTLRRIAMFRWLVGLAPVTEAAGTRSIYMACGAVAAWNPPGTAPNPHAPAPTAKCYSSNGAAGAGSANIGWGGRVPADAIDQYMEDWGNDTTFGHRRWLMNPPLGAVGIGFYAGGGPYGSAQCLGVFDGSGTGPSPDWIAFPPPGVVPQTAARWTWTFHHKAGVATKMTVTRASDGVDMPMTVLQLTQGFGSYGVTAFRPTGWSPAAGQTYLVSVEGVGPAPVTYQVTVSSTC